MTIDKVLKIEGASITWSCKQVAKMIENEKINFNNVVQRSFIWEKHRMSELIWSIIMGYPIPPIFAERGSTDNEKIKVYSVLDGRQRCTSISKYINDEFPLTKLKPIPYLDENGNEQTIDISGKKFSELDEELQDIIKDAVITVKYYDNLEQYQKAEMFRRLNNGKQLSTKSRTLASAKDIETLLDIGSHELFNQMLSDKSRANKNQVVIVAKTLTMLNKDISEVSFASKDFNKEIESMEISNNEKFQLSRVFDYIVNVHDELISNHEKDIAKKLYTETHLISLISFINHSIDNNITESMFSEWLIEFFKTENDSELYTKYTEACNSGVAKNPSITARHNALNMSYTEYFKEDDIKVDKENELMNIEV